MTTKRPRLLDLFCGAGGASTGYHRAGFDVVGVDINPQPRYPFEFHQADAMTYPLEGFDAYAASPPCQGYSAMRHAPGTRGAPMLIGAVRLRFVKAAATSCNDPPWCVENVEEARNYMASDAIMLCGSMFDLGAQGCRLQRHRLFECSFPIVQPEHDHDIRVPVVGVYGGHARRRSAAAGGRGTRDVWEGGHLAAASQAMGVGWMTLAELSEAIPPAYTEYVGHAMMKAVLQ
jgi:DNA (cytosine-5)-methyltransferase 1